MKYDLLQPTITEMEVILFSRGKWSHVCQISFSQRWLISSFLNFLYECKTLRELNKN